MIDMDQKIGGCHHCIGAAYTMTALIFHFLHRKAVTSGSLSPADIAELRRSLLESYASGVELFEAIHGECMAASKCGHSNVLSSHESILPALLSTCGHQAAHTSFKTAITKCGSTWLDDFFAGLAHFVMASLGPAAGAELTAAFLAAAAAHKSQLTLTKLLQEPKMAAFFARCLEVLNPYSERTDLPATISTSINSYIIAHRRIPQAHPARTTAQEMRYFLELLPKEAQLAMAGLPDAVNASR
ncbi:MAG TPA: hypothetical protein VFB45_04965 [Pseudolabrys sp.]|nr:hypothetical protein [Pseudolabrys sp.]